MLTSNNYIKLLIQQVHSLRTFTMMTLQVVNQFYKTEKMFGTMYTFGMLPNDEKPLCKYSNTYIVMCDGKLVGRVYDEEAQEFTDKLRAYKVKQLGGVSKCCFQCEYFF